MKLTITVDLDDKAIELLDDLRSWYDHRLTREQAFAELAKKMLVNSIIYPDPDDRSVSYVSAYWTGHDPEIPH